MYDLPASHRKQRPIDLETLLKEGPWLRRLAGGLVGEGADADDLTQEVLVAALAQRPETAHGANLRGWLAVLTRRLLARSRFREGHRRSVEHVAAKPEAVGQEAGERLELHRMLVESLDGLREPYRTALVLRYLDELPPRAIAAKLGLTETAARKRVSRGLALLRENLDHKSDREQWLGALAPLACLRLESAAASQTAGLTILTLFTLMKTKLAVAVALICGLLLIGIEGGLPAWLGPARVEVSHSKSAPDTPEQMDLTASGANAMESPEVQGIVAPGPVRQVVPMGAMVRVSADSISAGSGIGLAWVDKYSRVHELTLDDEGASPRPEGSQGARFFAHGPGLGSAFQRAGPEGEDVALTLIPGATVRGRVIEDGGIPVRPLRLMVTRSRVSSGLDRQERKVRDELEQLGALGSLGIRDEVETRADGTFEITGVPMGVTSSLLLPETHRYLNLKDGDESIEFRSFFERTDFRPLDGDLVIHAARVPSILGQVLWADDLTPVAGRSLWIRLQGKHEQGELPLEITGLNEEGRFEYDLDLEEPAMTLTPEQRAQKVRALSARFGLATNVTFGTDQSPGNIEARSTMPIDREFNLSGVSYPLDLGTLLLDRPSSVRFVVLDSAATPIPGAVVANSRGSAKADDRGRGEITCEGGDVLEVLAPGFSLGSMIVPHELIQSQERLSITLDPGVDFAIDVGPDVDALWSVQLVWESTPFEGLDLGLAPDFLPLPLAPHQAFHNKSPGWSGKPGAPGNLRLATTEGGVMQVPGLRPGAEFKVRLIDRMRQVLAERDVQLPGVGQSLLLSLVAGDLARTSLRFSVADTQGQAIDIASVFSRATGTPVGFTSDCPGGEGGLENVLAGDYKFLCQAKGYMTQELEIVPVQGATQTIHFVLRASRSLQIICEDPNGKQLKASKLRLYSNSGWEVNTWLKPKLNHQFEEIPREALTLVASIGTRTYSRAVGADLERCTLLVPVHEEAQFVLPRLLRSDLGRERIGLEILQKDAKGELNLIGSFEQGATGPLHLTGDLLPGAYQVTVSLCEYQGTDSGWGTERTVFTGEVRVRKGGANLFDLDLSD